jgi:hypothetical protein
MEPRKHSGFNGHAVKTLESKETKAQRNETVAHNSVFAAHRLQCRMTTRKIDIRHFVYPVTTSLRVVSKRAACPEHCAIRSRAWLR